VKSVGLAFILALALASVSAAQQESKTASGQQSAAQPSRAGDYSGMYAFRQEGEFVQITVEDDGRVTGFISRYDKGDSKGAFLDQFFKTAKLEGNKLTFTTKIASGISFDFKGTIERGDGKNPSDEAYYVLKGTLTENVADATKKVTSKSEDVAWKSFPRS
jgi:hypothetical protein